MQNIFTDLAQQHHRMLWINNRTVRLIINYTGFKLYDNNDEEGKIFELALINNSQLKMHDKFLEILAND